MSDRSFGDEGYHLLVDLEGTESANADMESVRQQRGLGGEPTMSRKEAIWRADEHLRAEKLTYVADSFSALPNGAEDLWIVSYRDPTAPEVALTGGWMAVTGAGEVRDLSSAPRATRDDRCDVPPADEEV